jgi:hypothetical protein
MKKHSRKLNLHRETLAPMQSDDLENVNGGQSQLSDPSLTGGPVSTLPTGSARCMSMSTAPTGTRLCSMR